MSEAAIRPRPKAARAGLRQRLARRGIDGTTLLVVPAVLTILGLFVYPFFEGLVLSLMPRKGGTWANYVTFFSQPFLWKTIPTTLGIAVPATVANILISVPVALRVRKLKRQRILTTILVVPITLGTVLVAEGLLNYLGPQGWLNRILILFHLTKEPLRLVHNYWGVMWSLIIAGFPFTFLLTLSYVSGIDPNLEKAAATLGAGPRARFRTILLPLMASGLVITFCLSFVQAFAVFPSAVLVGAPSGSTRVISIAAFQAAYERYDYSMASAIAMIMAAIQLLIVVLVLAGRGFLYRGPAAGGKG